MVLGDQKPAYPDRQAPVPIVVIIFWQNQNRDEIGRASVCRLRSIWDRYDIGIPVSKANSPMISTQTKSPCENKCHRTHNLSKRNFLMNAKDKNNQTNAETYILRVELLQEL